MERERGDGRDGLGCHYEGGLLGWGGGRIGERGGQFGERRLDNDGGVYGRGEGLLIELLRGKLIMLLVWIGEEL